MKNNIGSRILSFILIFCLLFTSNLPVFASYDSEDYSSEESTETEEQPAETIPAPDYTDTGDFSDLTDPVYPQQPEPLTDDSSCDPLTDPSCPGFTDYQDPYEPGQPSSGGSGSPPQQESPDVYNCDIYNDPTCPGFVGYIPPADVQPSDIPQEPQPGYDSGLGQSDSNEQNYNPWTGTYTDPGPAPQKPACVPGEVISTKEQCDQGLKVMVTVELVCSVDGQSSYEKPTTTNTRCDDSLTPMVWTACPKERRGECIDKQCDPSLGRLVCLDKWQEDDCSISIKPGSPTGIACTDTGNQNQEEASENPKPQPKCYGGSVISYCSKSECSNGSRFCLDEVVIDESSCATSFRKGAVMGECSEGKPPPVEPGICENPSTDAATQSDCILQHTTAAKELAQKAQDDLAASRDNSGKDPASTVVAAAEQATGLIYEELNYSTAVPSATPIKPVEQTTPASTPKPVDIVEESKKYQAVLTAYHDNIDNKEAARKNMALSLGLDENASFGDVMSEFDKTAGNIGYKAEGTFDDEGNLSYLNVYVNEQGSAKNVLKSVGSVAWGVANFVLDDLPDGLAEAQQFRFAENDMVMKMRLEAGIKGQPPTTSLSIPIINIDLIPKNPGDTVQSLLDELKTDKIFRADESLDPESLRKRQEYEQYLMDLLTKSQAIDEKITGIYGVKEAWETNQEYSRTQTNVLADVQSVGWNVTDESCGLLGMGKCFVAEVSKEESDYILGLTDEQLESMKLSADDPEIEKLRLKRDLLQREDKLIKVKEEADITYATSLAQVGMLVAGAKAGGAIDDLDDVGKLVKNTPKLVKTVTDPDTYKSAFKWGKETIGGIFEKKADDVAEDVVKQGDEVGELVGDLNKQPEARPGDQPKPEEVKTPEEGQPGTGQNDVSGTGSSGAGTTDSFSGEGVKTAGSGNVGDGADLEDEARKEAQGNARVSRKADASTGEPSTAAGDTPGGSNVDSGNDVGTGVRQQPAGEGDGADEAIREARENANTSGVANNQPQPGTAQPQGPETPGDVREDLPKTNRSSGNVGIGQQSPNDGQAVIPAGSGVVDEGGVPSSGTGQAAVPATKPDIAGGGSGRSAADTTAKPKDVKPTEQPLPVGGNAASPDAPGSSKLRGDAQPTTQTGGASQPEAKPQGQSDPTGKPTDPKTPTNSTSGQPTFKGTEDIGSSSQLDAMLDDEEIRAAVKELAEDSSIITKSNRTSYYADGGVQKTGEIPVITRTETTGVVTVNRQAVTDMLEKKGLLQGLDESQKRILITNVSNVVAEKEKYAAKLGKPINPSMVVKREEGFQGLVEQSKKNGFSVEGDSGSFRLGLKDSGVAVNREELAVKADEIAAAGIQATTGINLPKVQVAGGLFGDVSKTVTNVTEPVTKKFKEIYSSVYDNTLGRFKPKNDGVINLAKRIDLYNTPGIEKGDVDYMASLMPERVTEKGGRKHLMATGDELEIVEGWRRSGLPEDQIRANLAKTKELLDYLYGKNRFSQIFKRDLIPPTFQAPQNIKESWDIFRVWGGKSIKKGDSAYTILTDALIRRDANNLQVKGLVSPFISVANKRLADLDAFVVTHSPISSKSLPYQIGLDQMDVVPPDVFGELYGPGYDPKKIAAFYNPRNRRVVMNTKVINRTTEEQNIEVLLHECVHGCTWKGAVTADLNEPLAVLGIGQYHNGSKLNEGITQYAALFMSADDNMRRIIRSGGNIADRFPGDAINNFHVAYREQVVAVHDQLVPAIMDNRGYSQSQAQAIVLGAVRHGKVKEMVDAAGGQEVVIKIFDSLPSITSNVKKPVTLVDKILASNNMPFIIAGGGMGTAGLWIGGYEYLKSKEPTPAPSPKLLPFNIVKEAYAEEDGETAVNKADFDLLVKKEILKNFILQDGYVDSEFIKELMEMDLFQADINKLGESYELTTGNSIIYSSKLAKGKYKLDIAPIPGYDLNFPASINLHNGKQVILVGVRKGSGKVKKVSMKHQKYQNDNWLVKEAYAQEAGMEDSTKISGSDLAEMDLLLFDDKNGNGQMDRNEEVLQVPGIGIGLTRIDKEEKVNLLGGWNLVALQSLPSKAYTASSLASDINSQGGIVTAISTIENGAWKSFVVRNGDNYSSDDFAISPGKAYFVKSLKPAVFKYIGQEFVKPLDIDLEQGWNTVGLPGFESGLQVSALLDKINGFGAFSDTAARWESGLWDGFVKKGSEKYGEDFMIEGNRGYLIKAGNKAKILWN